MKKEHNIRWTVLIVLVLTFIWGNSLMPPQASWAISNAVQRFLSWFTPVSGPGGDAGFGSWEYIVRKAAHFTEFFVLGGLLSARFYDSRKKIWLIFLAAVLAALVDETIQRFTGRTSSVLDVWLDFCGAAAGALPALLFNRKGSPGNSVADRDFRQKDR